MKTFLAFAALLMSSCSTLTSSQNITDEGLQFIARDSGLDVGEWHDAKIRISEDGSWSLMTRPRRGPEASADTTTPLAPSGSLTAAPELSTVYYFDRYGRFMRLIRQR